MIAQASKRDPLATLKHHQLVALNVAFWIHKELDPKLFPRLPTWTLRHTETPWQWRTDGTCGLQLVVPNFAFWIQKLQNDWTDTEAPWQWRADGLRTIFLTVSRPSTMSTLPSRSLPTELRFCLVPPMELSPSYFPWVPVRPPSRFRVAPSERSSLRAISHGFRPSTVSSFPSLPTELSPSYFSRFPVCFRLAPSHRSSPQAIFHGFPSVQRIVAEVPLPRGKV